MGSEWEEVSLENHCLKIGSGATPRGGSSVYLDEGEFFLIRSQNIYNDGFKENGLVYITEEAADKLKNVVVEEKDILLNITGDSVARVCLANSKFLPARVNQHVAIIRPKEDLFDSSYLRYQLVSASMQNLLLNLASAGATRNAITKNMIETLTVSKPPLKTQKAIAHILGSLDDKIELNRQINKTLEAMAQALFKSWFVDFDPVIDNALAAGNAIPEPLQARAAKRPTNISQQQQELCKNFPSKFEFNEELGWVPKEWCSKEIRDYGQVITGKTPPKKIDDAFDSQGVPFITPTDVDGSIFITSTNRCLSDSGQAVLQNSKIEEGSICVTCIGSQMGKTTISPTAAFTNQQINTVIVDKKWKNYLFFSLRKRREEIFLLGSSGSTMPIINKSTFEKLLILFPDEELLLDFDRYIEGYLGVILENEKQNITLTKLRDTLLPKLLSGELRIPDAEKLITDSM